MLPAGRAFLNVECEIRSTRKFDDSEETRKCGKSMSDLKDQLVSNNTMKNIYYAELVCKLDFTRVSTVVDRCVSLRKMRAPTTSCFAYQLRNLWKGYHSVKN